MTMLLKVNKNEILQRASDVRHMRVFNPINDQYVAGFASAPVGKWEYQKEQEPIIDIDGFSDPGKDAWLSVNHYNAVVLNSRNMLIADVDFGDERISPYAGAKNVDEVIESLGELDLLDTSEYGDPDFPFTKQSYRVYRTHSGCRVICTSMCFGHDDLGFAAERFMRFIKSDRQYVALCRAQGCYRARLTIKPWRDNGEDTHVCRLVHATGSEIHPDLEYQLALHDEMTLPEHEYSSLA